MSLHWPFAFHCKSKRVMIRVISAGRFTLISGLVLATALSHAADTGCKAAYDDSTRGADVARCEAAARAGVPNAEFGYLAQIMLGKMLSDTRVDANLRNPVEGYAWYVAADAPRAAGKVMVTLSTAELKQP